MQRVLCASAKYITLIVYLDLHLTFLLLRADEASSGPDAMSTTTMDELDYDRRLKAYEQMDASFFAQLNRATGLLVLSQAVFDMGSEDISLRHSASNCLQSFVKFASTLPEDSLDNVQGEKAVEDSLGNGQGEKADDVLEDAEMTREVDEEVVGELMDVS